ncbi:F-box protein SKIP23-like [Fagus crenata]
MALIPSSPWLMLPSDQEDNSNTRCFLSLAEKKAYKINNVFHDLVDAWCVGSSQGWLVVLDNKANPHLFSPFSNAKIQLPSFPTDLKPNVPDSYFVQNLLKHFILKSVLLFDNQNKHIVVVIYGNPSRLAFCMHGDNNMTWTDFGTPRSGPYCDIICYNNQIYALKDNGFVEAWNFGGSTLFPTKIMSFRPVLDVGDNKKLFPRDKFSTQSYLVESMGELLLVNRFIGNFVNSEGVVVDESDLLDTEDTQPLMNEDYLYGGHDCGVFNLKDGSSKTLYQCDFERIDPPPFWIIPTRC